MTHLWASSSLAEWGLDPLMDQDWSLLSTALTVVDLRHQLDQDSISDLCGQYFEGPESYRHALSSLTPESLDEMAEALFDPLASLDPELGGLAFDLLWAVDRRTGHLWSDRLGEKDPELQVRRKVPGGLTRAEAAAYMLPLIRAEIMRLLEANPGLSLRCSPQRCWVYREHHVGSQAGTEILVCADVAGFVNALGFAPRGRTQKDQGDAQVQNAAARVYLLEDHIRIHAGLLASMPIALVRTNPLLAAFLREAPVATDPRSEFTYRILREAVLQHELGHVASNPALDSFLGALGREGLTEDLRYLSELHADSHVGESAGAEERARMWNLWGGLLLALRGDPLGSGIEPDDVRRGSGGISDMFSLRASLATDPGSYLSGILTVMKDKLLTCPTDEYLEWLRQEFERARLDALRTIESIAG